MRVVAATANPGKLAEIAEILATVDLDVGIEVVPRPQDVSDVVEDAPDLEGNARLKAVAIRDATGEAALADDTGLEVDALGGSPGVRSARFAGDDADDGANVAKLLADLESIGALAVEERRARFRTVILVVWPDGSELMTQGVVEGSIAETPRGAGGFGYDPVFVPDESDGRTFAQMSADEKNAISHRGRALRALARRLREHPM